MKDEQIESLVRFLPTFEEAGFTAGEWSPLAEVRPGEFQLPYACYGDVVEEFARTVYDQGWVLRDFDWAQWAQSAEAIALRDDEALLAEATPEQLARLLTIVIRQDRFVEGALLDAFESGLILRILRRAKIILDAGGGMPRDRV